MAKKKLKSKGKQVSKPAPVVDNVTNDVIAAAYSVATTPIMPVFMKVCRLCESKDGPFLNIFDADKLTAKKIDDLMPFSITENDDLPHKICFRCSAKLEELYEFIQKCIKTQESLRNALGKTGSFLTKSKMGKKLWEQKLTESNMSNDDICDALIKKAMEGIKGIPLPSPTIKEEPNPETKRITRNKDPPAVKKNTAKESNIDENEEATLGQIKLSLEKSHTKPTSNKMTRSSKQVITETQKRDYERSESPQDEKREKENKKIGPMKSKKLDAEHSKKPDISQSTTENDKKVTQNQKATLNNLSFDYDAPAAAVAVREQDNETEKKEKPEKPFNIMDYVINVKVNGVGMLFQCKLCNRNFLKIEIVESHSCAKNGVPKVDFPKTLPPPEPPKMPSVKYIKIDNEMKKSLTEKVKLAEKSESEKKISLESNIDQEKSSEAPPKIKPKPKVGPASKTKRNLIDLESSASPTTAKPSTTNSPDPSTVPSVHFPSMPNLNSRFKLVPGPNNVFSLVEDTAVPLTVNTEVPPTEDSKKSARKRKNAETVNDTEDNSSDIEVIDLEDPKKPYPVGLFQTVDHLQSTPATFTTPAMKKQSYTIVQTGNPSKLLISTKAKAVEAEVPKKRQKKTKPDVKEDSGSKEPFSVTLEDVAHPKDTGFFTFINVDPLLQPSYVLPTDNIIQESQISTSSALDSKESKEKGKYACNMCGESFSREKKLLAHIQSHYTKMDEEDQMRADKTSKKKAKK